MKLKIYEIFIAPPVCYVQFDYFDFCDSVGFYLEVTTNAKSGF